MSRLLVAGSRDLRDTPTNRMFIQNGLVVAADGLADPLVLVHGGQMSTDPRTGEKYGADYLSGEVWQSMEWPRGDEWVRYGVEIHRAEWKRYGRSAGPRRNQFMINLGADRMVAFPMGMSRGTRDCCARARAAGIPVTVYEMDQM